MAQKFGDPNNGFVKIITDGWDQIDKAQQQYSKDLKELENTSGKSLTSIKDGEDEVYEQLADPENGLIKANGELIEKYNQELGRVKEIYDSVHNLRKEYEAAYDAAIKATEAAYKYQEIENKNNIQAAQSETQNTSNSSNQTNVEPKTEAVNTTTETNTSTQTNGENDKLNKNIIKKIYNLINSGKVGSGSARVQNLTNLGYSSREIKAGQAVLNKVYSGTSLNKALS